jgi:hypothetical protein
MTVDSDFVKELAELIDGDAWIMADRLAERFPPEEWGDGSKARSGLYHELEEYSEALVKQHGVEVKPSHLRNVRMTAVAWPHADRSARAPFTVHYMLRGEDRFDRMERYLRKSKGPLTKRRVRSLIAEDQPKKPIIPWEERIETKLVNILTYETLGGKAKIKRPDCWEEVSEPTREFLRDLLRQLAREIGP